MKSMSLLQGQKSFFKDLSETIEVGVSNLLPMAEALRLDLEQEIIKETEPALKTKLIFNLSRTTDLRIALYSMRNRSYEVNQLLKGFDE